MTFEEWWKQHGSGGINGKIAAQRAWEAAKPKWQPIETAPKDYTLIILNESDSVFAGVWIDNPNHFGEIGWYESTYFESLWYSHHPCNPTHWMPLPEPK